MSLTVECQQSSSYQSDTTTPAVSTTEQGQQQQLNNKSDLKDNNEQQCLQHKEAGVCQARIENKYCVRYEGNNSKRWDGREIWVDTDYFEEFFEPSVLVPGYEVVMPWQLKNSIAYWKAVIVDPSTCSKYTSLH